MKVVEASYEILDDIDWAEVARKIERIGRVCYKSEGRITDDSAKTFVRSLVERGHESVIEHFSFSVRFICDRGISHEIVRHRLASYSQESTRYCNYSKEKFGGDICFIKPSTLDESLLPVWIAAMELAEGAYQSLIFRGATPQEARSVLPNSLKTEIVMTANLREWKHFFRLRTSSAAHPDMRNLVIPLYNECRAQLPSVFNSGTC